MKALGGTPKVATQYLMYKRAVIGVPPMRYFIPKFPGLSPKAFPKSKYGPALSKVFRKFRDLRPKMIK